MSQRDLATALFSSLLLERTARMRLNGFYLQICVYGFIILGLSSPCCGLRVRLVFLSLSTSPFSTCLDLCVQFYYISPLFILLWSSCAFMISQLIHIAVLDL